MLGSGGPASIFDVFAGHEIGRELKAMSEWLDAHRALLGLVAEDLRRDASRHNLEVSSRSSASAKAASTSARSVGGLALI